MKYVVVITGASSGFGALAARSLAKAGHVVYASMRDTEGRNASQVEAANRFARENQVDLRTVELDVQSQDSADAATKIQHLAVCVDRQIAIKDGPASLSDGLGICTTYPIVHFRSSNLVKYRCCIGHLSYHCLSVNWGGLNGSSQHHLL